ncbi:MAG: MotA/TolQ/ExbB proton channel family protein [Sulfurimonadaceae bacterium]
MNTLQANVNCSANFIVIALLPLLFFGTMIAGYLNIIPLNIPIYTLVYIGFIFFVFLLFIRHNANYAACKMRGTQLKMEHSLKAELISKSLTLAERSKSILDIDKFLNKFYIDIRNDNFVSVASSVFPMLGILGTFVAMAISMPNFSASSTDALDSEITVLLSGVGSAFFASIYGIFLSLLWTYFEKRGLSKIDDYFQNIETLFASHVWTEDELTIHQHSKGDLEDNRFLSALKETFDLTVIKDINEQQLTSFKAVMHESNQNFNHLATTLQHISQDIQESLSVIDQSTTAIDARNQIEAQISEFTSATHALEKSTKMFSAQMDNSLERTFEKIDYEIGDIVIKLADFATHVSAESAEVQKSIKKYHQTVAYHAKEK